MTGFRFFGTTTTQCDPGSFFDEGTDTTGVTGAGSVIIDNIDVNGTLIRKPGSAK